MSKKSKRRFAHFQYSSDDSEDDICIIDEVPKKHHNAFHHVTDSSSQSPITISDSSSVDEPEEFFIDKNCCPSTSFSHRCHFCKICDINFNSYEDFLIHGQEKSHQKAIRNEDLRSKRKRSSVDCNLGKNESSRICRTYPGYPPVPAGIIRRSVRDVSFIQSYIGRDFPPCPGLEHVIEIRGLKECIYFCGICSSLYIQGRMLQHLKNPKHQVNTLKSLSPAMYEMLKQAPKKKRKKLLYEFLSRIEKESGRGKITVEKDYPSNNSNKEIDHFQSLDIPAIGFDNRDVPVATHSMPEARTENHILSDKSKINIYCVKCEVNMFDDAMYQSHSKRYPHLKGLQKNSADIIIERRPKHEAFLSSQVTYQQEPIVGLDFVREFQHEEDKKETYHCLICGECASCIDIIRHLTSLLHRKNYLERIDHHSLDVIRHLDSMANKTYYIVEEICRKIQNEGIGPGCPDVFLIKGRKEDN